MVLREISKTTDASVILTVFSQYARTFLRKSNEYAISILYHKCTIFISFYYMSDVARYYIEETGALGEVPASLQNYIDYESYGRDLDLSGTFISTNHGIFEIVY